MINHSRNLRDKQRQVIKNILETKARKRKHFLHDIMNIVIYLTKKVASCIYIIRSINRFYKFTNNRYPNKTKSCSLRHKQYFLLFGHHLYFLFFFLQVRLSPITASKSNSKDKNLFS